MLKMQLLSMPLMNLPLISLVLLTATALTATAQASYPQDVVARYIEDCTAGRGAQARAVCTCIINGMQAKYTYEEFQILNSQISQTNTVPASVNSIIQACKTNPKSF